MARSVVVNLRANRGVPVLTIDGNEFPWNTDKVHGVKVEAHDDNLHLVIVAIQVDGSVSIVDPSAEAAHAYEAEQAAQSELRQPCAIVTGTLDAESVRPQGGYARGGLLPPRAQGDDRPLVPLESGCTYRINGEVHSAHDAIAKLNAAYQAEHEHINAKGTE